jgi:hypothetical protein
VDAIYSNVALLTMLPRALACVSIVAAFSVWLDAAPPVSEDVRVPAEVVAVGRALGLDPPHDRARFVAELARLLYTPPLGKSPSVAALLNPRLIEPEALAAEQPIDVPIPLTSELWGRILKQPHRPERIVPAIMTDRRAALLCYTLAALDDETLDYLASHSGVLARLYEVSAPAFAAFGASLRIHGGRVVPPGGAEAVALWESVVRERVTQPEAFVPALFQMHEGRIAYIYDTIAQLEPPKARFVLGLWMPDPAQRLVRLQALVDVTSRSYREWRLETLPFSRPLHDLAIVLLRMRVEPDGTPSTPGARAFWSAVFSGDELNQASLSLPGDGGASTIDAAWIAEMTTGSDMFWRGDRVDQFAFGQRVFAGVQPDAWPAAIVAIRAFPRQRMLSLTLERVGINAPAVYANIARQAQRMTAGNPNHLHWTLAQVQSGAALVARMNKVHSISNEVAERLLTSLFALPADGDRRSGAVAGWLRRELLPLLPPAPADTTPDTAIETRLFAALAGPAAGRNAPRVVWEGEQYRLDLAHGERHRLKTVREKQEGYSVDLAMALEDAARTLAGEALTLDRVRQIAAEIAALPDTFQQRFNTPQETRPPGVEEPRPAAEWLARLNEDLGRSIRNSDTRRAARVAAAILEAADMVLADALLSIAYAVDIGDPDGAALLARNVALRHDFGFGRKDADLRARIAWSVPRQDFLPGIPWHITGSVLGLDIAMASLTLRRISPDLIADAPRLPSNEREAFAVGLTSMSAYDLTDRDRDAIVAAIQSGRSRVLELTSSEAALETLGEVVVIDGWRRRALRWMMSHDRDRLASMFSLVELMALGGLPVNDGGGGKASGVNLDAWGMSALQSEACACTRLTTPRAWRLLSGRPQQALVASGVPDLNLYVAEMLAELGLPAALARHVLGAAILDFIEGVGPTDANDWLTVMRAGRAVPRELIEDYVAAAAAVDGPLVPDETDSDQP